MRVIFSAERRERESSCGTDMEIIEYTIRDLRKALEEDSLWNTWYIPITRHRALSQIHNPRAEEGDVALITAMHEGEFVGYMGILPDVMYIEGKERKFGWLSCWWVDPEKKHLHAAGELYRRSFVLYHDDVAGASYSPSAWRVYEASKKFIPFHKMPRCTYLLRMAGGTLLPSRKPQFKKIAWLLKAGDAILNPFVDLRLRFRKRLLRKACRNISFEYINSIDDGAEACIRRNQAMEYTKRGKKEFDWILRYPWVLPATLKDRNADRYYFSSTAKRFELYCIRMRRTDGTTSAVLILQLRDATLDVMYVYCDADSLHDAMRLVALHTIETRAELLVVSGATNIEVIDQIGLPTLYRKHSVRASIISTNFADMPLEKYYLQAGDGDLVFT